MESLATKVARVGPRIAVDQEMGGQGAIPFERFSTLWTLKLNKSS